MSDASTERVGDATAKISQMLDYLPARVKYIDQVVKKTFKNKKHIKGHSV